MTYKNWNDKKELQCYTIFRYLVSKNFPRGEQIKFSRQLASINGLLEGSISAKISNFKSLAEINNQSNASKNSKIIFDKYREYDIEKLIVLSELENFF